MGEHTSNWTGGPITEHVKQLIEAAIPNSQATVQGQGGHFAIDVVSPAFEGQTLLNNQRMVYNAITDLMRGPEAPIHAVDQLSTRTP